MAHGREPNVENEASQATASDEPGEAARAPRARGLGRGVGETAAHQHGANRERERLTENEERHIITGQL